jgi:hypothetical protein
MLTVASTVESQVIFNGSSGRLTVQNPMASPTTLAGNNLVYGSLDSGLPQLPTPVTAARVTVPYRLIAATTALLPALWLAMSARGVWTARRLNRRRRSGLCTACGYDLRGTPGAPRCPECGCNREPHHS